MAIAKRTRVTVRCLVRHYHYAEINMTRQRIVTAQAIKELPFKDGAVWLEEEGSWIATELIDPEKRGGLEHEVYILNGD